MKFRVIITGLMTVALLLSSCVKEYSDCPTVDNGYMLTLNIVAEHVAATRSGEPVDDATAAESFINLTGNDYCVYILDGNGRLMQRFEPTAMELTQTGDDSFVYKLSGKFYPEMEQMQVLVLANWKSAFGGDYSTQFDLERTMLSDLYADSDNFNFTYPVQSGTNSWIPDGSSSGIPMFGITTAPIPIPTASVAGTNTPTINVGDIRMLRALSKIEVVNITPSEDNVKITSCQLTTYNTTGRFIPDGTNNGDWNVEATQVSAPSLPTGGNALSSTGLAFAETTDSDGNQHFTVYVPEMDLDALGDSRPVIEIGVSVDDKPASKSFAIELAEYSGSEVIPNSQYENLLRNHWYGFNITKVEVGISSDLYIHVETKNWEMDEDELFYNDLAVEFAPGGIFHWTTAEYDPEEEDVVDGQGVPSTADKDKRSLLVSRQGGAEGVFKITEPARGTWTLALYGADDTDNSAFQIDLWGKYDEMQEDGSTVEKEGWIAGADAVSGRITGDEVKFRIVATGDNISPGDYSARLTMSVTTFDDRMFYVNLPYCNEHSADGSFDSAVMPPPTVEDRGYYTIIQKTSGDFN